MVVCVVWECGVVKGPKSNKLNLEHLEHLNVTLHDLKGLISVVWFHFLSLLLGVSFFHPNLPTWKPHDTPPYPTSVSATVRSKSLRTTATWTVIKSLVMVICMEIVEVSATTA